MTSDCTIHPALALDALPPLDAILVSHHQHADNFDRGGSRLAAKSPLVLTTPRAAAHLKGSAKGLKPFEAVELRVGQTPVLVTATPARHGPPLSLPLVGPVIGFVLEWDGQRHGAVYVSGDTVWYPGTAEVAKRFKIGTAFLHLGAAGFLGLRFTMDAAEGAKAARALDAKTVIPIHAEGWTHFLEPAARIQPTFERAGLGDRLRTLKPGVRTALEV
jgi:L-ascorbate metabolism protein UlaG (beta-lactamase superfamily)